jgi:hypothetical protein
VAWLPSVVVDKPEVIGLRPSRHPNMSETMFRDQQLRRSTVSKNEHIITFGGAILLLTCGVGKRSIG